MPHTNNKPRPSQPAFEPSEFVNINLTDDQKQTIKAAVWTVELQDDAFGRLLDGGYKCTIKFDDRNDCFAAWLIPPPKDKNKGLILSGRGSTPTKALKQLYYLHFVVLEGDWNTAQDQRATALDD